MAEAPYIRSDGDGVVVDLHVQPKASRSAVDGEHGGRLRLRIASPPVDGKANEEIRRFLAEQLGVAKSAVVLVRGATGRHKQVRIQGVSAATAASVLLAGGATHG